MSEDVLNIFCCEYDGLIPIFILGDEDTKIKRVMERRNFTEKEAKAALAVITG